MRVLLTGASGFIGSHVARHLVDGGDEVTAGFFSGKPPPPIQGILFPVLNVEAGPFFSPLLPLVAKAAPDACIHLAWYVKPDRYLTAVPENLASLVAGTRLLSALDGAGCPRAVVAGTCLEPGTFDGKTQPQWTIYAAAKSALHQV